MCNKLTYVQRFKAAIEIITNTEVEEQLVIDWINQINDNLQDWVGTTQSPWWCQNIAIIDAATAMADQPIEGEHLRICYEKPHE